MSIKEEARKNRRIRLLIDKGIELPENEDTSDYDSDGERLLQICTPSLNNINTIWYDDLNRQFQSPLFSDSGSIQHPFET
jgi:hypothetical protein